MNVTVGSDRDKRAASQPPFIVNRIPPSYGANSPQTIATHCLYFGGYLEFILTAAILMVPSVRFEASLPLVDATPVRVHSLVTSRYDVLVINPSGWQWLANDRCRTRLSWSNLPSAIQGEWAKMPDRANEGLGTNRVSRGRLA